MTGLKEEKKGVGGEKEKKENCLGRAGGPIKGSTRGPRGTKKHKSMSFTKKYDHCPDFRETIEVNIHERN